MNDMTTAHERTQIKISLQRFHDDLKKELKVPINTGKILKIAVGLDQNLILWGAVINKKNEDDE